MAAQAGAKAAAKRLGPAGVRLLVPALLRRVTRPETLWRARRLCLVLLTDLAKRNAKGLLPLLPRLFAAVMDTVTDTKEQVAEAATKAFKALAATITNPETVKLMPWLLDAILNPTTAEKCMDELMDCPCLIRIAYARRPTYGDPSV